LNRRLDIKIIVGAVMIGIVFLLLIAGVILRIRKRRKQRQEEGLAVAKAFQQLEGLPVSHGGQMPKKTQDLEQGVTGSQNGTAAAVSTK
jgi:type II secretory pathway pseudopilin PulG